MPFPPDSSSSASTSELRWIELPILGRVDADEVLLETPLVRSGLPGPDHVIDVVNVVSTPSTTDRERLVAAGHRLVARAANALAGLPGQPTARDVDAIETDLAWTGRIRSALVMEGLPAALQACEHWLGRPVRSLPRDGVMAFLFQCLQVTWDVVEGLEPKLADRLEARCVAAVDRTLATRTPPDPGRAAARHAVGELQTSWPIRELVAWSWLEPRSTWVARVDRLDATDRELISRRWGLDGRRPHRIAELAEADGSTATAAQRRVHAIEIRLRMNR